MRPTGTPERLDAGDLFRARLDRIVDLKHRAGAAHRQDRLGVDRRRDRAALQRRGPARDCDPLRDRASAAQAHLWAVGPGRVRALGA